MRPINKPLALRRSVSSIVLLLLALQVGGRQVSPDPGWSAYSLEQKKVSVAGFVHCYRTNSSKDDAFAQVDDSAAIRLIDHTARAGGEPFGVVILNGLRNAPTAKPDSHAEHWKGPYGFAAGLWWRGLDNTTREAYVQGVFWCAASQQNGVVKIKDGSVQTAVGRLNDWYVIQDDDWKDPRSNARVDIPVFVAMERTNILNFKK